MRYKTFNQHKHTLASPIMALLTLLTVSPANSTNAGLDWLAAQSQNDGRYALSGDAATAYQSTAETIRTFKLFNQSVSIYTECDLTISRFKKLSQKQIC
ncbi:MAG: hypothetical protein KAT04_01180 [Methylococcales bacterium]|nr:hypothetical protein [Methylococcales bacterium]